MAELDRNERARLGAALRTDPRLTLATRHVANALLFHFMGALGRAWPSYDALAASAGVSRSSAIRAIKQLVECGYISKTRRWANRAVRRAGRWMPLQLTNVYLWCRRLSVTAKPESRTSRTTGADPALPEGIARALEGVRQGIADRSGLPVAPA